MVADCAIQTLSQRRPVCLNFITSRLIGQARKTIDEREGEFSLIGRLSGGALSFS
jgi:hypothetical protein